MNNNTLTDTKCVSCGRLWLGQYWGVEQCNDCSGSIADCAEGLEPHDYQVEDFSGTDEGTAYLKCRACGKRKSQ